MKNGFTAVREEIATPGGILGRPRAFIGLRGASITQFLDPIAANLGSNNVKAMTVSGDNEAFAYMTAATLPGRTDASRPKGSANKNYLALRI